MICKKCGKTQVYGPGDGSSCQCHVVKLQKRPHVLLEEAKEAERLASREYIHYCDHGGLLIEMEKMKLRYSEARKRVDDLTKT